MFVEYLAIITAPTLAPHLDVVAIVVVVLALAANVAVAVLGMAPARCLPAATPVIPVVERARRPHPGPVTRGAVWARAPSVVTALSRA